MDTLETIEKARAEILEQYKGNAEALSFFHFIKLKDTRAPYVKAILDGDEYYFQRLIDKYGIEAVADALKDIITDNNKITGDINTVLHQNFYNAVEIRVQYQLAYIESINATCSAAEDAFFKELAMKKEGKEQLLSESEQLLASKYQSYNSYERDVLKKKALEAEQRWIEEFPWLAF